MEIIAPVIVLTCLTYQVMASCQGCIAGADFEQICTEAPRIRNCLSESEGNCFEDPSVINFLQSLDQLTGTMCSGCNIQEVMACAEGMASMGEVMANPDVSDSSSLQPACRAMEQSETCFMAHAETCREIVTQSVQGIQNFINSFCTEGAVCDIMACQQDEQKARADPCGSANEMINCLEAQPACSSNAQVTVMISQTNDMMKQMCGSCSNKDCDTSGAMACGARLENLTVLKCRNVVEVLECLEGFFPSCANVPYVNQGKAQMEAQRDQLCSN